MKKKKLYAVSVLKQKLVVMVSNQCTKIVDLNNMCNGCIGVMPCFSSKKAARKFAGKNVELLEGEYAL